MYILSGPCHIVLFALFYQRLVTACVTYEAYCSSCFSLNLSKIVLLLHEGDSLAILRAELKSQKKHVKNLKKKSLWSKILEEVAIPNFLLLFVS